MERASQVNIRFQLASTGQLIHRTSWSIARISQFVVGLLLNPETVSLVQNGNSEQVHRVLASGNFFSLLGTAPLLGQLINQQDDIPERII
jgi:hypothetical protein